MVHAVSHIHSLNIVHRDIKPENILVNKDYSQVVLSDFGMAVNLSFSTPTDYCGTPAYVAPDVHDAYHKKEPYSIDWKKCDVFSLGVTFYTIYEVKFLLGTRLQDEFFTPSQEELNTAIEYMDGREDLKDLLKKMICINPDERISIDEISQHPYLQ
jgi:serine/threonine protein kinase